MEYDVIDDIRDDVAEVALISNHKSLLEKVYGMVDIMELVMQWMQDDYVMELIISPSSGYIKNLN